MIEFAPASAAPAFTQRDEARMRQAAEKAEGAEQALETLKGMRSRPNEDLKQHAREKLEGLKRRLQQLSMLGASPRQLSEIARELSATVKDYGGAGGQSEAAGSLNPADDAFVTDARKLCRQLREAAAEAERRAWMTGDTSDTTEATRAAKKADEAIDEAERDMRRAAGPATTLSLTV